MAVWCRGFLCKQIKYFSKYFLITIFIILDVHFYSTILDDTQYYLTYSVTCRASVWDSSLLQITDAVIRTQTAMWHIYSDS